MSILKQYVEIERNDVVEHWHPECYMIQKVKTLFDERRRGGGGAYFSPVLYIDYFN